MIVPLAKSTTTPLVALLELNRVGARAPVDHVGAASAAGEEEVVADEPLIVSSPAVPESVSLPEVPLIRSPKARCH